MNRTIFTFITAALLFSCGSSNTESTLQEPVKKAKDTALTQLEKTDPRTVEPELVSENTAEKLAPEDNATLETETAPVSIDPEVIKDLVIIPVKAEESHVPVTAEIDGITNDVKNYTKSLNDRRYKDALGYVNPRILAVSSEEVLLSSFELMEIMDIKSTLISVDSLSEILEVKEDEFCKVYFKNFIDMAMPPEAAEDPSQLINALKSSGAENINFNKATQRLTMDRNATLLAAKYEGNTAWKYLDLDGQSLNTFGPIFPVEVQNELLK